MTSDDTPDRGDAGQPGSAPGPHTAITAAEGFLAIEPVLVGADDHLDAVIRRAGASPSTRVLGVVDPAGVLIGIVTSHDLVAAVVGRLAPGALLARIHDADGVGEYARYVEATVAGDWPCSRCSSPAPTSGFATLSRG